MKHKRGDGAVPIQAVLEIGLLLCPLVMRKAGIWVHALLRGDIGVCHMDITDSAASCLPEAVGNNTPLQVMVWHLTVKVKV